MKKIIILSLICFSSVCFAKNWQDSWSEAALLLEKGDFTQGKTLLDEAIAEMEETNDQRSYLYTDRARVNKILKNEIDALADVEKALSSNMLSTSEKIRALITKILLNANLNQDIDLNDFKQLVNLPEMEVKDKQIIIRNTPNNIYYKKLMTCYLVHSAVCYDSGEFEWLKSGNLIAYSHCGCPKCTAEYAKTRECDACKVVVSPGKTNSSLDEFLLAALKYVAENVNQLEDQKACLTALSQLSERPFKMELFENTFDGIFQDIEKTAPFFD